MPDKTEQKEAKAEAAAEGASGYTERLADITKWAVGALAAAGTFGVSKLSFDRLGKGDYGDGRAWMAFLGLEIFTLGIALIVISVVWTSRAGRVTLGYLRTSRHSIAREVRSQLETSPYLLNGRTSLDVFIQDLNEIVAERGSDPVEFKKNSMRRQQLALLAVAKQDALDTARAERVS